MYPVRRDYLSSNVKSSETYGLSKQNQFFLFMIRLRRATEEYELVSDSDSEYLILFAIFRGFSSTYLKQLLVALSSPALERQERKREGKTVTDERRRTAHSNK